MNKFTKFLKLNPADKRLYFQALFTSTKVKLMVTLLPLRWYAHYLGKEHSVTIDHFIDDSYPVIYKVSQAIVRGQKSVPWQNRCLVNAITAKLMLRKKGLESTLYLGVNKENQKMKAHAWLRCGTFYVTGQRGMEKFVVVNTFA